jgi:hypothetical protein
MPPGVLGRQDARPTLLMTILGVPNHSANYRKYPSNRSLNCSTVKLRVQYSTSA